MIDTEELQQELEKTQGALKKWAVTMSKAAQEGKNTHTRNMRLAASERRGGCRDAVVGRAPGTPRLRAALLRGTGGFETRRTRVLPYPITGEVDTLNDRYLKLERQAAEVQQCEPAGPPRQRC